MNKDGTKSGGRAKGVPNKSTNEIKDLLDSHVDFTLVVTKLFELSQGVEVQKEMKDGPVTYSEKPDAFAAKVLLEYRYGKPLQRIDEKITFEENQKFKIGDQEISF